jgi:GH15 family glucan-1,4-alpha-glucosidase
MGRPVVLSNGQLFVGLNKHGLVHDFYFPYVGLDNLTTTRSERHKIGVWVDGEFSWINDGTWDILVDFEDDALIGAIVMRNRTLKIELQLQDFVDPTLNAFCRQIAVVNRDEKQREIRLFLHQVFQISRAGRADTALYEPDGNYILDYKGRCSLLIYAETRDGVPFDQYAVGSYGIEDKSGTYMDAEDGELSGNAVEHGGVDSVIRLKLDIPASQAKTVDYWVACASSQQDSERIHEQLKAHGLETRSRETRRWWNDWMSIAEPKIKQVDPRYQVLTKKSLLVIKAHTDKRGSILASGDSSIFNYGRDYYCYCWPRDGAYAIWPLIRMGYQEEAKNFFEFCRDIIHEDGYLMHKYQPDRAIGSTWHPLLHKDKRELAIQEDETAIVIVMLGEYVKHTGDKDFAELLYETLIKPAAQFMSRFVDPETGLPHASYDLWEEKFLTSTYTTAVVFSALKVAGQFAEMFNFPDDAMEWRTAASGIESRMEILFDKVDRTFVKGYLLGSEAAIEFDHTLDVSSFYGMMMFGPSSLKEHVKQTADQIDKVLLASTPAGGTARYVNDDYMRKAKEYSGNPWFVCSFWLAQYYHDQGDTERAHDIMTWAAFKSTTSGILSEQVDAADGTPVSVAPLVWSHAEYINTALDLAGI